MAGLTSVLPNPNYVGDLDAGENTCGYVFSDGDKLVAALWTIQGDNGPTVRFQAGQLRDYLGNPIEGRSVRLTMAPVYAVGLSKSDAWYRQTAYSLDTPHLVAGQRRRQRPPCGARRQQPRRADRLPHQARTAGRLEGRESPKLRPASRRARPMTSRSPSPSLSPRRWD